MTIKCDRVTAMGKQYHVLRCGTCDRLIETVANVEHKYFNHTKRIDFLCCKCKCVWFKRFVNGFLGR